MKSQPSRWKRFRRRAVLELGVLLGPWMLRFLATTWKVRYYGMEVWEDHEHMAAKPVFTTWHENIPAGVALFRQRGLAVMISRHRDGELIARIIERLGYRTARGSSFDGGMAALREMRRLAEFPHGLVLTPDGPRGPARTVAPGAIYLAGATGRSLVATGVVSTRSWRARSWDRMIIPKPFARVVVVHARPTTVARDALREEADRQREIERHRRQLEDVEDEAMRRLKEWSKES